MPAPYIKSVLEDQSTRVTSSNGIIAGLVIEAKKGPINKPVLVTSQTNLLSRYTPGDKIEIGWDQAYYAGYYYLRDSNRLWVVRCAKDAKYGGIRVLKDGTTKPLEEGLVDPELHESEDNELFMKDSFGNEDKFSDWDESTQKQFLNELLRRINENR